MRNLALLVHNTKLLSIWSSWSWRRKIASSQFTPVQACVGFTYKNTYSKIVQIPIHISTLWLILTSHCDNSALANL